ncbi:hypothetical protein K7X08_031335 [Anisodus acutangulus]|uniref:Uncharacterized protein n=1 Tax=Anisodus acutangulus TaxID=402998 RepID=A0A9Q1MPH1_9SOLA|nr:hypothetical protein K7X08_031335 [Anisodus acutangulus]
MAKGRSGKRKKGGKSKSSLSFEEQRSIISNYIDDFLNGLKQSKNEEEQIASKLDDIEKLRMELRFLRTFVLFGSSSLDGFYSKMFLKLKKFNDHLDPRLLEDIKSYLSLKNNYVASATMIEEQLFEYLDCLLKNLHDLPKYCAKLLLPLTTSEYKILQEVCGHLGDFNGLKIKGCIADKTTECLSRRLHMTADRVTQFCFDLWSNEKCNEEEGSDDNDDDDDDDGDEEEEEEEEEEKSSNGDHEEEEGDEVSRCSSKIVSLLLEIIPVELEVLYFCTTKLKESRSTELGGFVKQILEASPTILQNYLILLQGRIAGAVDVNAPTQSISVMMEFLLIFFTDIPKRFIHRGKLNDMLAHVGVLTREISILVSKLEESSSKEENINEANFATPDFLQKVEQMKGDLRQMFLKAPKPSQLRFPMDDGLLFMNLLLRHLNDLLISNAYLVALMKKEIGMVKESLEFLRSSFGEVRQRLDDNGLLKDLWARALDVAYEAEHVINSILVRDNALSHLIFSLPSVTDKIKLIVAEVTSLQPEDITNKNGDPLDAKSSDEPIESTSSSFVEVTVGLKEEKKWIIDQLSDEHSDLDVISIVGMPGLGKTTLANKVYNETSVVSRFKVRAWCTVSERYNKSKVLRKILNQVTGSKGKESEGDKDDIAEELRGELYDNRYLIVLDDVWDIATGEMLIACFPKVKRGSRIILTSRSSKVGLQIKCRSDPLHLQLLTPEKSWELFEKKVFGEGSCPAELSDVGHQIVEKCQGLPLTVVLIAGVIVRRKRKKMEKELWLKIQHNLDSIISGNNLQIMKVMQLSYDHLPDHLKPLLLYFGRSQKNKRTPVSKLIQLLMAEGFVDHIPSKSLEVATQSYLDALISSSLIMVTETPVETSPFSIKIRVCYVHDVVHDFCSVKCKKEKFFKVINSGAPVHDSDLINRRLTIHTEGQLHKKCANLFNSHEDHKNKSLACSKHLISLKVKGWLEKASYIRHLRQLGLLRVLQLDNKFVLRDSLITDEIGSLVHLRFLKIWTNEKALPWSWLNLQNLETLVMGSGSTMVLLPRILKLSKLRHVSIKYCSLFGDEPTLIFEENSKSEDLTTLSHVEIAYSEDGGDALEKFPNLQNLECTIMEPMDPPTQGNWFPKFDVLTKLESLFADYFNFYLGYGDEENAVIEPPSEYHFPTSLKELRLYRFPLTPTLLSAIAALPKLEILELNRGDFVEDHEWDASEDIFQSLKTLCLDGVNLKEWQVDTETFPKLEELILKECNELTEIPFAFSDIITLKSMHVAHIYRDLGNSATEIKDYVKCITGEERPDVHVSDEYYHMGEMIAQNTTKKP